jgi:hypothetical protein
VGCILSPASRPGPSRFLLSHYPIHFADLVFIFIPPSFTILRRGFSGGPRWRRS